MTVSVYRKKGTKYFWSSIQFKGKPYHWSTKTTDRREALRFEKLKFSQLAHGEVGITDKPAVPRKTISQLIDAIVDDWNIRGVTCRSVFNWANLVKKELGTRFADELRSADIVDYVKRLRKERKVGDLKFPKRGTRRLGSGCLSNATIRNRFFILQTAYRRENESLAEAGLPLLPVPRFPKLPRPPARTGCIDRPQFDILYSHLPEFLKDYAFFAFLVGWRRRAIAALEWRDVHDGSIHLRAENSKNKKSYSVPIVGELAEIMQRRAEARRITTKPHGPGSYFRNKVVHRYLEGDAMVTDLVFHRDGEKINYIEEQWRQACQKSGCPNLLFHDLRRSARRGYHLAGVDPDVMKSMAGWETDAMASRYNVIRDDDKRKAMEKISQQQTTEQKKVVEFKLTSG